MNTYEHIPVLLNEVIEYLDPKSGQNFVDATLGGGGYTAAILEKIKPGGKVLAIDLDKEALDNFKCQESGVKNQVVLVHGNFAQIDKHVNNHQFKNIAGIAADLGLSSYELENRGISFQKKEVLDMRFDKSQNEDARFVVNAYDEKRLEKIFRDYGEEPFAGQIVKRLLNLEFRMHN
jgi:16S rRNA (cytosine1402-N4)-methyltransferase